MNSIYPHFARELSRSVLKLDGGIPLLAGTVYLPAGRLFTVSALNLGGSANFFGGKNAVL